MRNEIVNRKAGILTYGITPPKESVTPEKRADVAQKQTARISKLPVDGLVVYDIQDESGRTNAVRPFPFKPTVDPVEYALEDLSGLTIPKVVYRCIAPLTKERFADSLEKIDGAGGMSVFVGAASPDQETKMTLGDAYQIHRERDAGLPLGGVLIAERHAEIGGEHERVLRKLSSGCSFFITQAVYSATTSRDILSDLYYAAEDAGVEIPPVIITLSPCGSLKTLEFLRWLGVHVPRWIENELRHAHDTLATSLDVCTNILENLVDFGREKNIPIGCNIESVSIRKEEIEASVELVNRCRAIMDR